ncbi:MAG TPA: hypothetical protein VJB90_04345 [Candidatus Nanoarchaeia archaeon]|nr:hypothetical protein [Candidatus Nanoarchaeia archaeon]
MSAENLLHGMRRAIISVTDKSNLLVLLKALAQCDFEVISTGGTARAIQTLINEHHLNLKVLDVTTITDFPEVFRGRLKSIHPLIEGAILFDPTHPGDQEEAEKVGIKPISLVVCNFYKFKSEASGSQIEEEEMLESMDIGGPTMVTSAIKNYKSVGVITDLNDYAKIANELISSGGELSLTTKRELAVKAINNVADYRAQNAVAITRLLASEETLRKKWINGRALGGYGENWHQSAIIFQDEEPFSANAITGKQLHGAEMSFNNYVDAAAGLEAVREFGEPCCTVIKHTNPCGLATGKTILQALERAWQGDPVSAFGGVIAFNRDVGIDVMKAITERLNSQGKHGWFVEAIVAPSFAPEALEYIKGKKTKERLRLIAVGHIGKEKDPFELKDLPGGILVQDRDNELFLTRNIRSLFKPAYYVEDEKNKIKRLVGVTTKKFPPIEREGLFRFAWIAAKHTKSNAVVIAREYEKGLYQVIGMGAGQPNRKDAGGKLAKSKASENLTLEYDIITGRAAPHWVEILASEKENFETWRGKIENHSVHEYITRELGDKCVVASDAFFPFRDGIDEVADIGVKSVIQPGGAMKDSEVIEAANEHGMTMIFTGMRHFKH